MLDEESDNSSVDSDEMEVDHPGDSDGRDAPLFNGSNKTFYGAVLLILEFTLR